MKKFTKKLVVGLLAAMVIVGSSFTTLAASDCLHVRDYGCHNFTHRDRGTDVSKLVLGITQDGRYWHVKVTVDYRGECVCGMWGTYKTEVYYDYERTPYN